METNYKVIAENNLSEIYIDVFEDLEAATKSYNKLISFGYKTCYLLKTEIEYRIIGGSCNKILSKHRTN